MFWIVSTGKKGTMLKKQRGTDREKLIYLKGREEVVLPYGGIC
jgi:hypothetical protein